MPTVLTVEPARPRVRPRHLVPTVCGGLAALVAAWLMVAPFVLGHGRAARWNDIFAGVLLLAFGAMLGLLGIRNTELTALLAVLAGWLILSPALLSYGPLAASMDRAIGGLILLLAVVASPAAERGRRRESPRSIRG